MTELRLNAEILANRNIFFLSIRGFPSPLFNGFGFIDEDNTDFLKILNKSAKKIICHFKVCNINLKKSRSKNKVLSLLTEILDFYAIATGFFEVDKRDLAVCKCGEILCLGF